MSQFPPMITFYNYCCCSATKSCFIQALGWMTDFFNYIWCLGYYILRLWILLKSCILKGLFWDCVGVGLGVPPCQSGGDGSAGALWAFTDTLAENNGPWLLGENRSSGFSLSSPLIPHWLGGLGRERQMLLLPIWPPQEGYHWKV